MPQVFEDIIVDAEFAALIPPLSAEERQQLEENIIEHGGARDPLVVWASKGTLTLLDGHNRYEICTRLGLPFDIHEMRFKSREEAADWIDRNQLGRRNLDPRAMSLLRGRRYLRNRLPPEEAGARRKRPSDILSEGQAAERLAKEHGVSARTIERDGKFAEAVETLGIEREVIAGEIDAPKHEIVAAAAALPEKPTAADIEQAVETVKARPHVANNSGDNEWYTPKEYIEAARQVLGKIDLDPASNPIANELVRAATYYTAEDSGLDKDWQGTLWMNPPYESGLIGQFVEKLCDSYASGAVTNAIVLVNNATETRWFQSLAEQASAICFPKGRVKFWHPAKPSAAPLQGQAILFLGPNTDEFARAFSQFGFCMEAFK
jgi:phage N-6-adenine-methyltransferase